MASDLTHMLTNEDGLLAVALRRRAQAERFGGPAHDDKHTRAEWIQMIREHAEAGLATDALRTFEHEMQDVAALAIAAASSARRKAGWVLVPCVAPPEPPRAVLGSWWSARWPSRTAVGIVQVLLSPVVWLLGVAIGLLERVQNEARVRAVPRRRGGLRLPVSGWAHQGRGDGTKLAAEPDGKAAR